MSHVELLPCPFCGRAARMVETPVDGFYTAVYHAECASCEARTAGTWENEPLAIEAWNRRPSPWRSVEHAMPPEGQRIAIAFPVNHVYIGERFGDTFAGHGWEDYMDAFAWWMPLPEPPKEVEG